MGEPEITAKWVYGDAPAGATTVWLCPYPPRPLTWSEYADRWIDQRIPPALRDAARSLGHGVTGRDLSDGHWVLSDGRVMDLTGRACATLLAAIDGQAKTYVDYL